MVNIKNTMQTIITGLLLMKKFLKKYKVNAYGVQISKSLLKERKEILVNIVLISLITIKFMMSRLNCILANFINGYGGKI